MKLIKDGKVAVLVSADYGAGWSTWCGDEHLPDALFDAEIVQAVLSGNHAKAEKIATQKYKDCYAGGVHTLEVEWVPVGSRFYIQEYDGAEQLVIIDDNFGYTA